jgi:hypothetical protein
MTTGVRVSVLFVFVALVAVFAPRGYEWSNNASAAELSYNIDSIMPFTISGKIEPGDSANLRKLFDAHLPKDGDYDEDALVRLNSPGGDLNEALDIGQVIREYGIGTVIGPSDSCLSACALIFMAGTFLEAAGAPSQRAVPGRYLHVRGQLGFHAFYEDGRWELDFSQGVKYSLSVATRLIEFAQVVGLDMDLLTQALKRSQDEYVYIDTPLAAQKHSISLWGYARQTHLTEDGILSLCNAAVDWERSFRLSDYENETRKLWEAGPFTLDLLADGENVVTAVGPNLNLVHLDAPQWNAFLSQRLSYSEAAEGTKPQKQMAEFAADEAYVVEHPDYGAGFYTLYCIGLAKSSGSSNFAVQIYRTSMDFDFISPFEYGYDELLAYGQDRQLEAIPVDMEFDLLSFRH